LKSLNRWLVRLHWCIAGTVALLGFGCATIAGLDEDFEHAPKCDAIRPPAAPSVKNAGDSINFAAAIRTVDLDEEDDIPRFGFDIDNKCSCTIDGPSCKRPSFVDPKKETCDDDRGLDNGSGVALGRISALSAGNISSVVINEGATQGLWTLIVGIRDYSGTPNDDRVTVALYETPGLTSPAWNGTDIWPISKTTVGPSGVVDDPVNVDTRAYVRDGVLVAHIPKTKIRFRASTVDLPVELSTVTISAKIAEASAGNWRLTEGTLAARWPLGSLFKGLSEFRYGSDNKSKLCRDDIIYLQVKSTFCSATDVLDAPSADITEECNAISFGMRFDTESVRLGAVTDPLPPPDPACGVGFDPATDSCMKPN
jgi:hypothetical protein